MSGSAGLLGGTESLTSWHLTAAELTAGEEREI